MSDPTPKEVAFTLKHKWTAKKVRKLLRRGKIPGKQIGGRWYVDREWVIRTLNQLKEMDFEEED